MEDLVWPGQAHKPPLGKPEKFHLKIVTLEENPFVIFKNQSSDGNCAIKSVLVRVAKETNQFVFISMFSNRYILLITCFFSQLKEL
jgi:hypothetical protein